MEPMNLELFQPTLEKLCLLKKPEFLESWPDYKKVEVNSEIFSDLIKIIRLETEKEFLEEPHYWLPIHAWRILSIHQNLEALPVLIECLLSSDPDDDWIYEELPDAFEGTFETKKGQKGELQRR